MILRSLPSREEKLVSHSYSKPAWAVFIESQREIEPPYAIIFQAKHSKLAGDLAELLSEEAFGKLDADVIQAIGQHDFGWRSSDDDQMKSLGWKQLRAFPGLSAEETLPSWRESIAYAASISSLVEVLVSRHFTLLGKPDPQREEFVRYETERRSQIECRLEHQSADLDRWTGAVGFCDLLSLYLCSGSQQPAEFPLAHPADHAAAASAAKTSLFWQNGLPRFASPVLKPGARFSLSAFQYSGIGPDVTPITLEWRFPQG